MTKKFDLLSGTRILEEVDSPINGKVRVLQSLGWGNTIQTGERVGTLTQSGGVVQSVWKTSLTKIKNTHNQPFENCLILGLGGGSNAKIVRNYWPDINITGVEIDPIMIDLGMRYLGLSGLNVNIKTQDAKSFCESEKHNLQKYDLILMDVYITDQIPEKFDTDEFIQTVSDLMSESLSLSVFNRLYYDEKINLALRFREKLSKHFNQIDTVFPEANVMYICSR